MGHPNPSKRRVWKRFLLVAALPGLPLLLLLFLGRGMRHEFGNLDYFAQDGTRVERPANAAPFRVFVRPQVDIDPAAQIRQIE